MIIRFNLNGENISVEAPANINLLTLLHDNLGLTGTKSGCEVGECGACSVLVDGKVISSCLMLAPQVNGKSVITIEGIHDYKGGPDDLQMALLEKGGVQCGYCTPGIVMAGEALLARNLNPTEDEIREALAGNLCRCTGYQQIVEAIDATASLRRKNALLANEVVK
jgi:aerobic carbon-monoxide dehydrogenase small subunit